MANFCRSCGSPLNAGAAFCPQCGSAAASAPNNSAANQPAAPQAAPVYGSTAPPVVTQGSSGMKIVLVILCCLAAGGAAVVGGVFYAVHRVKQAVSEKAHEYGVDLPSNSSSSTVVSSDILKDPCKLISKAEVSSIIGQPVDRAEVQDAGCLYFGPPGLSAKLGQEGMSNIVNAPNNTQTPGAAADNITRMMTSVVAAQSGQGANHGEAPLLMLVVGNDGRAQMTAVVAGKAMLSGLQGSAEEIPGLGDRAIRLGNLGLNVLKGEVFIRILPGPIADANQKAIAVARMVVPRI